LQRTLGLVGARERRPTSGKDTFGELDGPLRWFHVTDEETEAQSRLALIVGGGAFNTSISLSPVFKMGEGRLSKGGSAR
jgi:hypothetical protein